MMPSGLERMARMSCSVCRRWTIRFLPVLAAVVLLVMIAAKSAISALIYDEAFTLGHFTGALNTVASFAVANNHPLNSLLIHLLLKVVPADEFFLRLPNLLAGALYLAATVRLIQTTRAKLLAAALCLLNVTVINFFSLARGYGLAVALVQFGLVEYYFVRETKRSYAVMLAAVALACTSIFSTVVFFYILLAVETVRHGARQWRVRADRPKIRRLLWPLVSAGLAGLAGLWPLAGLFFVSQPGNPLYGSDGGFFDAVLLGFVQTYLGESWDRPGVVIGVLVVLTLLALLSRRSLSARTQSLAAIGLLTYTAVFVASALLGKPLPTGRVLLPYVPVTVLAVISLIDDVIRALGEGRRDHPAAAGSLLGLVHLSSLALLLVFFLSFRHQYDFRLADRWTESVTYRKTLLEWVIKKNCLPAEGFYFQRNNPATDYYTRRLLGVPAADLAECPASLGMP